MTVKIALAGNPNCGKTTLFNSLTGSSQYVGNWPGVTVEKKEGRLKGNREVIIQDLPGIYSLSPYTLEEVVARNYLIKEQPDVILNIVDASNLERNLYLTTQLTELGLPVVIALNMMDVVRKNGDKIEVKKLAEQLGCPVVEICAFKDEGVKEAAQTALSLAKSKKLPAPRRFGEPLEPVLQKIEELIAPSCPEARRRYTAIKLFEGDEKALESLTIPREALSAAQKLARSAAEELDDDGESIVTDARYREIGAMLEGCFRKKARGLTTSDKIDRIVTNRWLALPIFALVMTAVYFLSVTTIGTMMTDWVNDVLFGEIIPPAVEGLLVSAGAAAWLQSLILDGIIAGVGAVLGFLPQMMVLFLCLALLEDCGYMARIAFIMDRIFRKFGLSGKSFIPMLIGLGCGVPGVMASRTIENDRDRKMTVITTTFVPCSAKLPVIALIAGALFGNAWWVGPSAYFVGFGAIIVSGIILKKTKLFAGEPAPFVMELPAYHLPTVKGVLIHMWDRAKSFVRKAGTIIFLSSALIWFLQSFNWRLEMVDAGESILASIGGVIAFLFTPLGWGDWRAAVAAITGLIAKENVVNTFGILFGYAEVAEDGAEFWGTMPQVFSAAAAYSFLVFNLLCAPCFAAIGAIRREMGSARWTLIAVGYQTIFAYAVSLCIYQFGSLFAGAGFGVGTLAAILVAALIFFLLFRPNREGQKSSVRAANRA